MSRLIWRYISVATMLVVSVDAACPSSSTVIDLCDANAFGGDNFYIDSARMAEGHHQCSCILSTKEHNRIQMVAVTTTTSCRSYWYNVTLSLGRNLDTFTYEYQNGSCVFPQVWGKLTYSSIPWSITITRRGDGPSQGGERDPGVCMHVSSAAAFFVKCGNNHVATTSTVLETSATSLASSSTTAIPISTAVTSSSATFTPIVSTSAATTSTSAAATSTSTVATSTSTVATSAAATSPTTFPTSSQILGSTVHFSMNSSTTAAPSTSSVSTSVTTLARRPDSDSIAIGASVFGLLLLILLVTLCVYIDHRMRKTYTKKDVENVVYVTDNI